MSLKQTYSKKIFKMENYDTRQIYITPNLAKVWFHNSTLWRLPSAHIDKIVEVITAIIWYELFIYSILPVKWIVKIK